MKQMVYNQIFCGRETDAAFQADVMRVLSREYDIRVFKVVFTNAKAAAKSRVKRESRDVSCSNSECADLTYLDFIVFDCFDSRDLLI